MRQKSNVMKIREPSKINGRSRRDTVKKKVPDKVFRGWDGGQIFRKDSWEDILRSQKRDRRTGMNSCPEALQR